MQLIGWSLLAVLVDLHSLVRAACCNSHVSVKPLPLQHMPTKWHPVLPACPLFPGLV